MFSGLFGRSQKRNAVDATKALRDAIEAARGKPRGDAASAEEIARTMQVVKDMLFPETANGASGTASPPEEEEEDHIGRLVDIARSTDLLLVLGDGLSVMGFETRKDAVQVFNNLLRRALTDEASATQLVGRHGDALVATLVRGYDDADIALNCGAMLRECIRCEALAGVAIRSAAFWRFFDLVEVSDFDVASDAFASFRDMLIRHVPVGALFIEQHYDRFTTSYNKLLRSPNYVTRRQSLKLLGVLLIERKFFRIMTRYIASPTNLRLVMNLLLDRRSSIQFEAFHVFKIFVANPNKTPEVRQILLRNKERLLSYLEDFLADRQDSDASFNEDRTLILEEIRKLS